MQVLDPGHIYQLKKIKKKKAQVLIFVKRSGGAIKYDKEWPGLQTQAVMRALINFIDTLSHDREFVKTYDLWQLGTDDLFKLTLTERICDDVIRTLVSRSRYLNIIINCVETSDAVEWLKEAERIILSMRQRRTRDLFDTYSQAAYCVRMALWCYEARAYRRKVEGLNRKKPEHDDSARLRSWRDKPADDVPFSEDEIELRPIGDDGHIIVNWST